MKKVILSAVLIPLASSLIPLLAAEGGEESGFGAWRISVGGALNGGVSPSVRSSGAFRGLAVLPALPAGQGKAAAAARHTADGRGRVTFGDGFIDPDSEAAVPGRTWNWRLPKSAAQGNSFVMEDTYVDAGAVTEYAGGHVGDSDQYEPGISVELSRTLWSDKERGWGVDLALAASYFFGNDIYDAHGTYGRSQSYETGTYRTEIDGAGVLDEEWVTASGGYYGIGSAIGPGPLLPTVSLSANPMAIVTGGGTVNAASSFDASGDYRELEMFLMARPWYEITDWWRVFGEVGLAVSWSQFDFEYSAIGAGGRLGSSEDFSEWRCYGVAGAGTVFRLWQFDLSFDFLARFLNDDLDCNGKYCSGSIEKSDWLMRVMVGWEF